MGLGAVQTAKRLVPALRAHSEEEETSLQLSAGVRAPVEPCPGPAVLGFESRCPQHLPGRGRQWAGLDSSVAHVPSHFGTTLLLLRLFAMMGPIRPVSVMTAHSPCPRAARPAEGSSPATRASGRVSD